MLTFYFKNVYISVEMCVWLMRKKQVHGNALKKLRVKKILVVKKNLIT